MIRTLFFSWKQELRDYTAILFGILCYSVGCVFFQMPFHITTGGATGVGLVVYYATGTIPVQYTYFALNMLLILCAFKILGWRYCLKTLYGILCLTILLAFMQWYAKNAEWTQQYIETAGSLPKITENAFMACLFGAMLEGIGLGIVFTSNGSTGGTDIIVAIINKFKDFTMGQLLMSIDILIVTSSLFTPVSNLESLLYSYCTLVIAGLMVDFVIDRNRQSVQFFIVSQHSDEIAKGISETGRGVTVLHGHGWYTKNPQQVLMVMAKRRESTNLFRIIHGIDPNAFVSQSKVAGVFGEGFDKMKVKGKGKKA